MSILIHYSKNNKIKDKQINYNPIFDRINSIKARIAYNLGSIPRLTLYKRLESKANEYEFNVDSFNLNVESKDKSYEDFVNDAEKLMKLYNIKDKKDYTLYWIYYNKNFRDKDGNLYETIEELKKSRGIYELYTSSEEIKEFFEEKKRSYSEFENIYRDVKVFAKNLDDEYRQLHEKITIDDKNFTKLESKDMETIERTPLEITQTILELTFEINKDIYELFNKLQISKDVPFANINKYSASSSRPGGSSKYYKILRDFIPPVEWSEKTNEDESFEKDEEKKNILYMQVLNIDEIDVIDPKYYSQVEVKAVNKIHETNIITLLIESIVSDKLNQNKLINRILNSLNIDEKTRETIVVIEKGIKGTFQIPRLILYDLIIRDLAINDKLFSNFIVIDESRQVEKVKTNIYLYFVFNSFTTITDSEDSSISVSLNQMVVMPNDYKLINQGFVVNEKYIEVKIIKSTNKKDIEQFTIALSKLLKFYKDKESKVIKKYSQYISDFETKYVKLEKKQLEKRQRRQLLKDIVPKIFKISQNKKYSYNKKCEPKRQPDIINEKNYTELLKDYELPKDYLQFLLEEEKEETKNRKPLLHARNLLQYAQRLEKKNDLLPQENKLLIDLYGEDWKTNIDSYLQIDLNKKDKEVFIYPRSNEEPRKYICTGEKGDNKYIYSGVVENTDPSNKELFPFFPCCFESPSYNINPSKKLANELKMERYYGFGSKLKTNPLSHSIQTNKFVLENRIGEFLPRYIYEFLHTIDNNRTNVYYRKGTKLNSNSCLEAISIALNLNLDDNGIKNKRKELLKYIQEIQQTMYQYNNNIIIDMIKKDHYISPKLFLKALEDIFNCYIFVFSRDKNNPDGYLAPPNYAQEFYDYKQLTRKYVLLYEHSGVEDTQLHCEVIAMQDDMKEKKERAFFKYNDDIIKKIKYTFTILYINNDNGNIQIPDFKEKILGQAVDYFGKTRYLKFKNVIIFIDPLPNLNLPLINEKEIKNITNKNAIDFLRNIDYYEPVYLETYIVGYKGKHKNINFYMPIERTPTKIKPNNNDILIPLNNVDQLHHFNILKRLSRYILEYVFYIFSYRYLEGEKKELTDEYILEFAKDNIIINPEFKYSLVKRLFDINNVNILDNQKIILPDIETLKRVLYILKLNLTNNTNEIINYSKRQYIKYYYEDINDFDKDDNFLILSGDESLKHLILSKSINYHITDTINAIIPPKIIKKRKEKNEDKEQEEKKNQDEMEKLKYNLINQHINSYPYLFNNEILNNILHKNQTFIVQPVLFPEIGAYICKVYEEKGYNIGNVNTEEMKRYIKYSYIVYNSNTDITLIGDVNVNRLILVYKIIMENNESINLYQALLPITHEL